MVEDLMAVVAEKRELRRWPARIGGGEVGGGMKSQCPTRARQVAARAFSRGWMSVRFRRDAHSGISIGRKTPTPRILDDRQKKSCSSSSPAVPVGADNRRRHRRRRQHCVVIAPPKPPPTERNRLHTEEKALCHGKIKYGRTHVKSSWSGSLRRWSCRSRWRWPSRIWRTGCPPPVRLTLPRSKRTWPRIKVSSRRSSPPAHTLVPPTLSRGPRDSDFAIRIACTFDTNIIIKILRLVEFPFYNNIIITTAQLQYCYRCIVSFQNNNNKCHAVHLTPNF